MATTRDSTLIEVPIVLRDLIARQRLHSRQALHEVIEEAFLYWEENGAWQGMHGPWSPSPSSSPFSSTLVSALPLSASSPSDQAQLEATSPSGAPVLASR